MTFTRGANGSRQSTARRLLAATVLAATAAAGLLPQAGAAAQEGLPLTLENIYRAGRGGAGNPSISPDGRWVTFTGRTAAGNGLHRIAPAGGEPIFWGDAGETEWAPDSQSVVFTRGDRLWRLRLTERQATAIMPAVRGARGPVFSPDGRTIAFTATEGGHQDIWVVPAEGGQPRQLTHQAMAEDDGRFDPAWSPDGRSIAFVSNKANYWSDDVWVVDVSSGTPRQLTKGITVIGSAVQWSPKGDRLAVFGTAKTDYWYLDLADIFLADVRTGTETKLRMEPYVTAYGHRTLWSPDGRRFYFVYQQRGEHHIWSVPAEGGTATRVSQLGGVINGFDATAARDAFVFTRSSETEGSDIYYLPAIGGPERRLTSLATRWQGLQAPREIAFQSFDGLYVQGFLYSPPGLTPGRQCPALVQVHGGGTNSYMQGQNLIEQYLASKGFVVLAINYRGGSGFGRAFQDLAVNDWLNGQARDPGPAADLLRTLPYVNGKVGIYGGSYGGMQSMAAITRTPDTFDAAVPMRGIYSQSLTFEHMDRLGRIFSKTGHGGLPAERPEIYSKSNTIERFAAIRVPLLIMHGELDDRAPYKNHELAVAELKRLGKTFEAKSYPGEGHGFRNPDNQIDMYQRLEAFFVKHLGRCS
jgi:dipeptidyl aminopeptidase/acylaminoacyl peptidase